MIINRIKMLIIFLKCQLFSSFGTVKLILTSNNINKMEKETPINYKL